MASVERIDHIVLTVRDIPATIEFYTRVLGMKRVTFGDGRTALAFGNQKINLHQAGAEFEPKAMHPAPGSGDVCFITMIPLTRLRDHLEACGVEIVEGPARKIGALGEMESLYVRDPDGNLIELSNYPHG